MATKSEFFGTGKSRVLVNCNAKIQTCRFLQASDVFDGFSTIKAIFDHGGDYDFSWGDNNRSLIDAQTLREAIKGQGGIIAPSTWEAFCERLEAIPDDCLIDLEN